jgi:hypothetical protein
MYDGIYNLLVNWINRFLFYLFIYLFMKLYFITFHKLCLCNTQVFAEHRLVKSYNDYLLLPVSMSLVVNRILLYGDFHLKGGLLYVVCGLKPKIEETLSGSIG